MYPSADLRPTLSPSITRKSWSSWRRLLSFSSWAYSDSYFSPTLSLSALPRSRSTIPVASSARERIQVRQCTSHRVLHCMQSRAGRHARKRYFCKKHRGTCQHTHLCPIPRPVGPPTSCHWPIRASTIQDGLCQRFPRPDVPLSPGAPAVSRPRSQTGGVIFCITICNIPHILSHSNMPPPRRDPRPHSGLCRFSIHPSHRVGADYCASTSKKSEYRRFRLVSAEFEG